MANILEINAINALVLVNESIQEQNYTTMANFFDDLFTLIKNKITDDAKYPDTVESSYVGVHINEKYEESDFLKMIEAFRGNQMIHAKYALQILNDAIRNYEKQPNIPQLNLNQHKSRADTIIVGDLHGSFKDLYYIINKFGVPGKNYRFIFNGDFVDRGSQQCEVLLTLLFAYLLHPKSVFLNRGNHEDLSINVNSNFSPNFRTDTKNKFNQYSLAVFKQTQRLFRRLPIATILENKSGYRCFVCHGGISDRLDLDFCKTKLNRFSFPSIILDETKSSEQLSDLMWSDPIKRIDEALPANGCYPNKSRGIGCAFGEDISEKFCKKYGFNTIVRSHELRRNGWSKDHPYCYTVFTASNYCNGKNKAAVLILDSNKVTLKEHEFETEDFNPSGSFEEKKAEVLKIFKDYLESQNANLMKKFKKYDKENTGWLDVHKWAEIISEHISAEHPYINPKFIIYLKDNLCPCNETDETANYAKMINSFQTNPALVEFLQNAFNLIDLDQNGTISKSEAKEAIKLVNNNMGTHYDESYISKMDANGDGVIDFKEFAKEFTKAYNLKRIK